jgi:uncharacterized protein (DUF885 family)
MKLIKVNLMRKTSLAVAIASLLLFTHCSKPSETGTASNSASSLASSSTAKVSSEDAAAQALYQKATEVLFQARPLSASGLSLSSAQVGKNIQQDVDRFDSATELKLRSDLAAIVSQLAALPTPTDPQAAENLAVMQNIIAFFRGDSRFSQGYIDTWMGHSPFIINQINGPIIDMPGALINSHPINNLQDAQSYLARLAALGPALLSVRDKYQTDVAGGWIPPRALLDKTLPILRTYGDDKVEQHVLYQDFAKKLTALNSKHATALDTASTDTASTDTAPNTATASAQNLDHASLLAQAKQHIAQQVIPAYQQLSAAVQQSLPHARQEAGIWAQPNGAEFYAYAVQQLGDTSLTPAQIHQIGLDEVARISAQMDKILRANGYADGSVGDRMAALNDEPRFLYPDSDEGRAALLADLNRYIQEMDQVIGQQFATRPPYPVEVRRIPVEVQDSAAGGQYTSPAIDGSKPGIYWINLADMKANAKFDLKTLTYHEANPGHHWQIALNLAQDQLPLLRRIAPYNAYAEGWGLYAELVAYELGMYKNDAFGDLGRLKAELFRAVRLVVDTGLHAKKWTREQAIQYMAATTGTASSDVISEIERYMAWPGQALGYKLGMLKIVELRQQAKTALGDKFDIKAFHDTVLLGGAVPMQVLEARVKAYINAHAGS